MRLDEVTLDWLKQRCVISDAGCWMWSGCKTKHGYANLHLGGKLWRGHRLAWTLANGPVPAGKSVLHHCDNTPCCNPEHVYVGTQADNVRDRHMRGRNARQGGEVHGNAKLSNAQVLEIRKRHVRTGYRDSNTAALAAEFGVTKNHIRKVVARKHTRLNE